MEQSVLGHRKEGTREVQVSTQRLGKEWAVSSRFPTVKPIRAVLHTSSRGNDHGRQREKA